jgi:zinc transporter, ZIP family
MLEAILLGAASQSSLLLSGLVVYWISVSGRVNGSLAGFGAGALVGAIAFDLIPEAKGLHDFPELALWLLIGAGVFVLSDRIVEARFGSDGGKGDGGPNPLGIVVGATVDGIPESVIFGIQLALGQPIGISFLAAVFLSNIPQALAPSADLEKAGWHVGRMLGMWGAVVGACAVMAGVGFVLADALGVSGDRAAAFAAGGLLAMLTDSLMPFAFDRGGSAAGVWTVVGFAASMASA